MTDDTSRRRFLEMSALGLIGAVAPQIVRSAAAMAAPNAENSYRDSEISIWVTSDNERFAAAPRVSWHSVSSAPTTPQIHLNPAIKFQEILGFGGAFTDATCYMFNRLLPPVREKLFHELFHPSEMGLSVGRICVGSSDYSTKLYSFDEGEPDPELKRFSIEHDREYILPVLKEARQANPDLFLFSSPWSPPGWMKFNGTMLGGSMRRYYLGVYAQYYLKFLHAYTAEGVPVQALT
ncbi:MAG TPA: hypothetical protein VGV15_17820, partial [Terriglobales bacterium]|nr:hypothetical protein [Terriglobales bacterium]